METQNRKYWTYGILAVLVIASILGVNQYHYGMWNHFATLPWLYDLSSPELFPNDPLVDQRENSPSLFLPFLHHVYQLTGLEYSYILFALYIIVHAATFASFYWLGRILFTGTRAALLSVFLLAASFPVIGDVAIWETVLMERTVAYPILIFSIGLILKRRYLWAVALQAIAFNIHPLSAAYVVGATWFAVIWTYGFRSVYWLYALSFLALASPVLFMKFSNPTGESTLYFKNIWWEVMQVRNAHHAFPSAYPLSMMIKSGLLLITYYILVYSSSLEGLTKRFLAGFGFAIICMMAMGTVFTEWIPFKIIIQMQFFRSFLFLTTLTFVLWAGLILHERKKIHWILGLVLALQYVQEEYLKGLSIIVLMGATIYALTKWHSTVKTFTASAAGYAALGVLALVMRGGFSLSTDHPNQHWNEVQEWFKDNTASDVLAIVPPQEAGFRVNSHRSSYGDWYDGTKAFFNEEYARTWRQNMHSLGCKNPDSLAQDYRKNAEGDFIQIAENVEDKYSNVLVVQYSDVPLSLPVEHANETFTVYRIPARSGPVSLAFREDQDKN